MQYYLLIFTCNTVLIFTCNTMFKYLHAILCFIGRFGTGTLTSVFLDRVFQECLTYEGEMVNHNLSYFCCVREIS